MALVEYVVDKAIGTGSYGTVYKVIKKDTQTVYAMKKLSLTKAVQYEKVNIINELRILATHKCPFIVRFKTAFVEGPYLHLVTEFAESGDLGKLIALRAKSSDRFLETTIWHYLLQISLALSYLHKLKIIHRDLKPANVFIDADDNVKLGDFGVVKMMRTFMLFGQTQIGTPLYMSPEIYKRERYDTKADMWALGCILYECMTLKPAFHANNMSELKRNIYEARIGAVVENYTVSLKNLLTKLINIYPRQRPTIAALLAMPVVREQLTKRRLECAYIDDVEPAFHVNCVVPKQVDGWHAVVQLFINLNSTIVLNDEERGNMDIIQNARKSIDDNMNKRTTAILNMNVRINKLGKDILDARKFISECEDAIRRLMDQKLKMEQEMGYEGARPRPPAYSRLQDPSPRVNHRDIRPMQPKALRLR